MKAFTNLLPVLMIACIIVGLLGLEHTVHSARADVFLNVPEASGYELVYTLPIPDSANYNAGAVPYSVDNSSSVTQPFDRVAYYLELQKPSGQLGYAYVSMDAFTADLSKIGVPTFSSGAVFQQPVCNMNVVSNVAGIVNGNGLSTGNIEFWPTNYGENNLANVPGADSAAYDFGDYYVTTGTYGSMQIHNYDAAQTIMAYNQWNSLMGSGSQSDLGIGNQASDSPDWTFALNSAGYSVKNMQVLVRPGDPPTLLQLSQPTGRAVFQRDDSNLADVAVQGTFNGTLSSIEARAVLMDNGNGTPSPWQVIDSDPTSGNFTGSLILPAGGWYEIQVRGFDGQEILDETSVERVGVGEVFITAGQSNSCNFGQVPLVPQDDRVSAHGPGGWQTAADPQPGAHGTLGSPWPALGDLLAQSLDIPVGFLSVGYGGSSVSEWQPEATHYPKLKQALELLGKNGFRAVLWHQGETDAYNQMPTEQYVDLLSNLIAQSRDDAGWDVPWGVALATYCSQIPEEDRPPIIAAQQQVIDGDPLVFLGPYTDALIGPEWRYDNCHFNEAGLREHARLWHNSLNAVIPEPNALLLLFPAAFFALCRRRKSAA